MKVVVYGATGRAGSRILRELLSRGHRAIAVTRQTGPAGLGDEVDVAVDDLSDVDRTVEIVRGAEAVVSAYAPPQNDTDRLVAVTQLLLEAVSRAGVARFLMVGGAGVWRLPRESL